MGALLSSFFRRMESKENINDTSVLDIDTSNFAFLHDAETIDHIQKTHVMFIMRGPSGCGKSTTVNKLRRTYPTLVVCSADRFFYDENDRYNFDQTILADAHEQCKTNAGNAVSTGMLHVVIDNTNIRRWEMSHYLALAGDNGYAVILVAPGQPWLENVENLEKRGLHGVDAETLLSKIEKFEEAIPMYWAWFLNVDDSKRLMELADKCFSICCHCLPDFLDFLKMFFYLEGEVDARILRDRYTPNGRPLRIRHCTAFFAGYKNRSPPVIEYSQSEAVRWWMGRSGRLRITGIVVTRRTFAARVLLDDKQLEVYQRERYNAEACVKTPRNNTSGNVDLKKSSSRKNKSRKPYVGPCKASCESPSAPAGDSEPQNVSDISEMTESRVEDIEVNIFEELDVEVEPSGGHPVSTKMLTDEGGVNGTGEPDDVVKESFTVSVNDHDEECVDTGTDFPDDSVLSSQVPSDDNKIVTSPEPMELPTANLPPGSRAHITLGFTETSQAYMAGEDMLDILAAESEHAVEGVSVTVDGGQAKACYYGEGRCAIWFDSPVIFNGLFTGKY